RRVRGASIPDRAAVRQGDPVGGHRALVADVRWLSGCGGDPGATDHPRGIDDQVLKAGLKIVPCGITAADMLRGHLACPPVETICSDRDGPAFAVHGYDRPR